MPKYAVIDTETSGLPIYKNADGTPCPADDPRQPRLAHLAVVLLDEQMVEEDAFDLYVKPDGWEMSDEVVAINGLTTEFLSANGVPVGDVLNRYVEVIDQDRVVIAYNAQFDLKVMRGELRRAGMDDMFDRTLNVCAMRSAQPLGIKKANGKGGAPQLGDVCAHFGIVLQEAHKATHDARACAEVARRLRVMGALIEPKIHLAKTSPLAPSPVGSASASVPEAF